MSPLSGRARRRLRALAHREKAVLRIGKQGLSEPLLAAVREALLDHELVKVRLSGRRDRKRELERELAERTGSELVGTVGHIAILYREHPDPRKRKIEIEPPSTVHLVAIAGVGMTSLAGLLRARGVSVTGSDVAAYPPASTLLERLGVPVAIGFRPENLEPPPDLAVIGNAVSRSNPEVEAILERNIPYASMPEALYRFFLADRRPLVVAGTHGKSTSTAMLAWTLERAGRDPSMMVGAESIDFQANYRLGGGDEFVLEGDEYDSAFFDKGPKFLHYSPAALLLTSIEFDHADIYGSLEEILVAFRRLVDLVPSEGPLVVGANAPHAIALIEATDRRAVLFGTEPDADCRATSRRDENGRTVFRVIRDGVEEIELGIRLMGEINVRNTLGVYALGRSLGLDPEELRPGLESFLGVRRRQEVLTDGDIVVLDDFAHHPTAIAGTLDAVRARYPSRRLWGIFEPRSNTSRRRVFQHEFPRALGRADAIVVAKPFTKPSDPIPESERLSADEIVAELRSEGRAAWTASGVDDIRARLDREVRDGDVLVFMSNGAFGGLPRLFADALSRR